MYVLKMLEVFVSVLHPGPGANVDRGNVGPGGDMIKLKWGFIQEYRNLCQQRVFKDIKKL
jgi:hypothetical protein